MKKILFLSAFCLALGVAMAQQPVKPAQAAPQQQAQPAAQQHQCSGQHANCPHHQAQAQQPKQEAKPACNGQHANCPHHAAQQADPKVRPQATKHVESTAAPRPVPADKRSMAKPSTDQQAVAAPKK